MLLRKRDEIALWLFSAYLSSQDAKISLWPELAEKQIRLAFEMANTFLKVAEEMAAQLPAGERE